MKTFIVRRCIFPVGKAVLGAFGEGDKFLGGLVCHPKSVSDWCRAGCTSADRKKLKQLLDDVYPNQY